jgi:uncharacterized membrane protein
LIDAIENLPILKEFIVIILSATPISELRVAIPLAITTFGFKWYYAFLLAIIGNMLPVPFILLFIESAAKFLSRIPMMKKFFDWLFSVARKRSDRVQKYKFFGLLLFVAIPLPITGAWTGSLIAVLLGIGFKQAFFSILAGVIIAGIIVTCLTLLGWTGAIIAGIALLGLIVFGFLKSNKKKQDS